MNTDASPLDTAEVDLNRALAASAAERGTLLDAVRQRLLALPATIEPARQVALLRQVAEEFYKNGDRSHYAMAPIAKAAMMAATAGDIAALRHCRSIQCLVLVSCGHLSEAMAAGVDALDLSRRLRLPQVEATAWTNLAYTLLSAELTEETRTCASRAIRLATMFADNSDGFIRFNLLALPNHFIASSWEKERQPTRARRACLAAMEFLSTPQTPYECQARALMECTAGAAALELNDVVAARDHADSARGFASQGESVRATLAADTLIAHLDVRFGQVTAGLQRLAECAERARTMGEITAVQDALKALVDAHEFLNQPDRAYRYLRELTDLVARKAISRSLLSAQFTIAGQPTDSSGVSVAASGGSVAGGYLDLSDVALRMRAVLSAPRRDAVDQYYAGA